MKLNETNSKFAVVKTALHKGGTICFTNSLKVAEQAEKEFRSDDCACGCCEIIPVNEEGKKELRNRKDKNGYPYYYDDESIPVMYSELKEYEPDMKYTELCK